MISKIYFVEMALNELFMICLPDRPATLIFPKRELSRKVNEVPAVYITREY